MRPLLAFAIPARGVAVPDALAHTARGDARAVRCLDGFLDRALVGRIPGVGRQGLQS